MSEYPKISPMILNSEIFEDKKIVVSSKPTYQNNWYFVRLTGLSKVDMRLLFRS